MPIPRHCQLRSSVGNLLEIPYALRAWDDDLSANVLALTAALFKFCSRTTNAWVVSSDLCICAYKRSLCAVATAGAVHMTCCAMVMVMIVDFFMVLMAVVLMLVVTTRTVHMFAFSFCFRIRRHRFSVL